MWRTPLDNPLNTGTSWQVSEQNLTLASLLVRKGRLDMKAANKDRSSFNLSVTELGGSRRKSISKCNHNKQLIIQLIMQKTRFDMNGMSTPPGGAAQMLDVLVSTHIAQEGCNLAKLHSSQVDSSTVYKILRWKK